MVERVIMKAWHDTPDEWFEDSIEACSRILSGVYHDVAMVLEAMEKGPIHTPFATYRMVLKEISC